MKVSASVPSEVRSSHRVRRAAPYAIAVAWLAAHLPFLAPSLEDVDSVNFALGLHQFSPALHQPHPPGYPVFIALGRASLAVVHAVAPSLPSVRADALALAIWSAVAGAIAIVAAAALFRAVGEDEEQPAAEWAVAILAAAPLFWMTGLRPMSDMTGLAAALGAMALIVRGMKAPRALIIGAAVAGLAAGVRVQTVWLTLPLLVLALFEQRRAGAKWLVTRPLAAYAAAVLAWAIPLVIASGGLAVYQAALVSQAAEDFVGVGMLWTSPTARHLALALYDSFVLPWASLALATGIGIVAAIGVVLLRGHRRALLLLVVAFAPYAVMHLLFQETITARYALPLVPVTAYLVARALMQLRTAGGVLAAMAVASAAAVAIPGGVAYGRETHPAFVAVADMEQAASVFPPVDVYSHIVLRRALETAAPRLPLQPAVAGHEWLGPEEYWRSGGMGRLWFVANGRRTDLALIDPEARDDVTQYQWRIAARPELSGTRPTSVAWYRFDPPGWFAGEGWSLTPETAGVAEASGKGLAQGRPIEAFVRRWREPVNMLVGGSADGVKLNRVVTFDLALDGRVISSWPFDLSTGQNFLQVLHLPDGVPAGTGAYARLTIAVRATDIAGSLPRLMVTQFNVQPARVLMYGLGEGWYDNEADTVSDASWRWTGARAVIAVVPPQAARLVLRGESPLKYFGSPPTFRVTAGTRVLAELRPTADFTWRVDLPAADVLSTNGRIAITTDRIYLPGQAERTADMRLLGIRVFDVRVNPVNR